MRFLTQRRNLILIGMLVVFETIHIFTLFGRSNLLAGGDNYTYLQLGRGELYPYTWDVYVPFGGRTYSMPNLLGLPLLTSVFSFVPAWLLQRLLLALLYILKYIGFAKLVSLISKRISPFALIPAVLLFVFNAFATLNPFALFPLMFGAYLPFSLYYFIKLYYSSKVNLALLTKLVLLSVLFSSLNSNLPLAITIFIPQLLFVGAMYKCVNRISVINIGLYYFFFAIVNIWWVLPLLSYFFEAAVDVVTGGSWFSAINAGALFLNFRFIGQWAWYSSHYLYQYYPFNSYYDLPVVILITYLIVFAAFIEGFRRDQNRAVKLIHSYFLLLAFASLFLVGGSRQPFGFVYELFFNAIPGLKVFREPFTKFGELYVLAISGLFYMFLLNIEKRLHGMRKYLVFVVVLVFVLVATKPALFGEHVWDRWNGSVRTFRVSIPSYWLEFEEYLKTDFRDARILTVPRASYGSAWNWPQGISSADDIAVNFVAGGNNIIRNPLSILSSGELIDAVFKNPNVTVKYLAMLGVTYVLRENDLDWRYAGTTITSPSQVDSLILLMGLVPIREFGDFTAEKLLRIPNWEPDINLRNELYVQLYGRPALIMYGFGTNIEVPLIYATTNYIIARINQSGIIDTVSLDSYEPKSALYTLGDRHFPSSQNQSDMAYMMSVAGVREKIELSNQSLVWNKGWLWPEVNVSPIEAKYKLVPIKEAIELMRVSGDYKKKIDLLVWYAAKRVTEISKYDIAYDEKVTLAKNYSDGINQVTEILRGMPVRDRSRDYWEVVKKAVMYMKRSNEMLKVSQVYNNDIAQAYDEFFSWVTDEANILCGELCYEIEAPTSGEYRVLVDKNYTQNFELKSFGVNDVKSRSTIFSADITKGQAAGTETFWMLLGKVNLENQKVYKLNLDVSGAPNLLDPSEWLAYTGIDGVEPFSLKLSPQSVVPGYSYRFSTPVGKNDEKVPDIVLWSDYVKYKRISNWEANQKYRISFDYSAYKGGLGYSIVEEVPDYKDYYNKLKSSNGTDFATTTIKKVNVTRELEANPLVYEREECTKQGECLSHYEKEIDARRDAVGAYLYIYAFPDLGDLASVTVKNLRVEKVMEPKILLVREVDNAVQAAPSVSFDKINPTKYVVHISNVKAPYTLVFNDSYNQAWRLHYNGREVASGQHYRVNGFANSWYIKPQDMDNQPDYELTLEFAPQRTFEIFLWVMIVSACASVLLLFSNWLAGKFRISADE